MGCICHNTVRRLHICLQWHVPIRAVESYHMTPFWSCWMKRWCLLTNMSDLIAARLQNPVFVCFHWTLTDKRTASQMSTKFACHFLSSSCPCSAITATVCSHCSCRTLPVYFKVRAVYAASLVWLKTGFLLDWTPPCRRMT